jgi:hypothetical protein
MSSWLELPARHRPPGGARWRRVALGALVIVVPVAWLVWYVNSPSELPVTTTEVVDTGVVGTPLYIGMFNAPSSFDRTLHVSGVKVHTTADADLEVTPLLCRSGNVTITTDAELFCQDVVDPAGKSFRNGDAILVKVDTEQPVVAVIDRISIGFREDIRWGTSEAGIRRASVRFFAAGAAN